jgi:hypothetical protein
MTLKNDVPGSNYRPKWRWLVRLTLKNNVPGSNYRPKRTKISEVNSLMKDNYLYLARWRGGSRPRQNGKR